MAGVTYAAVLRIVLRDRSSTSLLTVVIVVPILPGVANGPFVNEETELPEIGNNRQNVTKYDV
jgi:hypothetical protein